MYQEQYDYQMVSHKNSGGLKEVEKHNQSSERKIKLAIKNSIYTKTIH